MHIVEGGIQKYHVARNKQIGKFTLNQVSIPKDSQFRLRKMSLCRISPFQH